MAWSPTAIRLARAGASLLAGGCAAVWMWIHEASRLTFVIAAIALGSAVLLQTRRARALSAIGDLLLLAVAGYALHGFYRPDSWRHDLPAGEQHFDRLPSGTGAHALLALSALFVLGYLVVRLAPTAAGAIERVGRRLPARVVLLNAGLVLALFCAADLFSIDRGAAFSLPRARFHPFLAYDVPDSYAYRHATERAVKDTRGISFQQKKPEGVTRVVLAGASTVWGHQLPVEESLSRALQAALDRNYPTGHYEVIVVAFPGKLQLNELIDATVTLPHWAPDLVVSFNGWNEGVYGEETDHYEGMPYIAPQIAATLATDPLAAWWYEHSFLGSTVWRHRLDGVAKERVSYADDPAPYEPPRYFAYLRSTARTLREAGIPYAYAFCPNVHEMPGHPPEKWGGPRDPDVWTRERRQASREIVEGEHQIAYDVMRPLVGDKAEAIFMDDCHLNARGTRLLAEDLAQLIPEWLAAAKR